MDQQDIQVSICLFPVNASKKLTAVLSDETLVSVSQLKEYDLLAEKNLPFNNVFVFKVIDANHVIVLGLFEIMQCKNGATRMAKAIGMLKQCFIVPSSRKMIKYQRTVRNRQIERASKIVVSNDPEEIKQGLNAVRRFIKRIA